jgi:hypothetical protein
VYDLEKICTAQSTLEKLEQASAKLKKAPKRDT